LPSAALPDRLALVGPRKRRARTWAHLIQTLTDERCGITAAANTAAKPLDNAGPGWTAVECRPRVQTAMDDPGRCAYYYGSEGRGPVRSERNL